MKKNIIYLIGIAVIITAIFLYTKFINQGGLSDEIILKDTSGIFKIVIEKSNQKIIIYRKNNKWFLKNDVPVREKAISYFLKTLSQVKIKSPVHKEIYDSLLNSLNSKGKRVIVYDENENSVKKWIIGNYSSEFNASYLLSEGSKKIYLVNIPGVLVDLNKRIQLNELYWIKRDIFKLEYYDIKEISMSYSDSTKNSFKLKIFKNNAEINYTKNNTTADSLNFKSIGRYLTYFRDVKFYNFPTDLSSNETDSILESKPLHVIELIDKKGNKKKLKTFPKIRNGKLDIHNVYADINDEKKLVIVKYYDIDLLLKDVEYFIL